MSHLRFLPYLGSALLVVALVAIVLTVVQPPEWLFPVLLALAITAGVAGILCVVFGLLLPLFARNAIPSAAALAAAAAAGRLAPARVLSSRSTGIRINLSWEFAVDLVVAPTDRAAYRGIQYLRVPNRWTGIVGRGAIITVVRVDANGPRVVMARDSSGTDKSQPVPMDAPPWQI